MNQNSSRVAVVTGAASGIGRATVERLSGHGWSIVAADIDGNDLGAWVRHAANVVAITADVSRPEDNEKLVATAVAEFGRLDTAILNAGVSASASVEVAPLEMFENAIAVNLMGVVHGVRAALPSLRNAHQPTIVVTASVNGLGGDNSMSAYCASKFGAVGLVKALARELGFEGIRINAVCPGPTRTGMIARLEADIPEVIEAVTAGIPLGRWAEPDEIASAIEFLASPDSSFISGVALPVDGAAGTGTGVQAPARGREDLRGATIA
jgi:NAD(P)-dependent dehydrogenase (short-subunit alcohol dehydrogenase family)